MIPRRIWFGLHLTTGLAWVALLAMKAHHESLVSMQPIQVGQMLLWAGWLPSAALAAWQAERRRWKQLILSDCLAAGVMVAIACTIYLPLFFFQVVWFLPFALLPRGCLTQALILLWGRLDRK